VRGERSIRSAPRLLEEQLVRRYRGTIEDMARTLLDGTARFEVEDLVQTAMLDLLEAARRPNCPSDPALLDLHLRSRIRQSLLDQCASAPPPPIADAQNPIFHDQLSLIATQELWFIVQRAMLSLPASERGVLQLHYLRDSSMSEIGNILGVTQSRVSQIHQAALARLRSWVRRFER
jgi:RNA polymerase sigma factor (sigma-70 family)